MITIWTSFLLTASLLGQSEPTGNWIIQLDTQNISDPEQLLDGLGLELLDTLAGMNGAYLVAPRTDAAEARLKQWDVTNSSFRERRNERLRELRAKIEGVGFPILWTEPELVAVAYSQAPPDPGFNDPSYADQWHLNNDGQSGGIKGEDANVIGAWLRGYRGTGINIAIVDEGVDPAHPDLSSNFQANLSRDFLQNDDDTTPVSNNETHGVAVAGVAAARDSNSEGVVGVAPRAGIASLRILDNISSTGLTSSDVNQVLLHQNDSIHIYNNSWGYGAGPNDVAGFINVSRTNVIQQALQTGALQGRNQLGSIIVWAAGNGLGQGDNANYDNMVNSIYTIAVAAVGDRGTQASYSNPGAALLVSAPSSGNVSGIVTTDLVGTAGGSTTNVRDDFGGTSSASPVVAGVAALMLEANPNLTWRDVQYILARTAVKIHPEDEDWILNGAGYHLNHKYGFGRVDATAAVRVAEIWNSVPAAQEVDSAPNPVGLQIPDNNATGLEDTLEFNSSLQLEHVILNLQLSHNDWGDLEIILVSPDGTESLMSQPFLSVEQPSNGFWEFMTVRNWGENAMGTWKLIVRDRIAGTIGTLSNWSLTFRGITPGSENNTRPTPVTDTLTTVEISVTSDVTANDTDPDGHPVELISVYRPPNTDVYLNAQGELVVENTSGFRGVQEITYTISDGNGGVGFGTLNFINPLPDAIDDQVAVLRNRPVLIFPIQNDLDADSDALIISGLDRSNSNARIEVLTDGSIRYTPPTDFTGTDSFFYTLKDLDDGTDTAQVSVVVPAVDDFALDFDGVDNLVEVPNTAALNLRGAFTLEAWVYPTGYGEAPTGFGRIVDKESFLLYLNSTDSPFYPDRSFVVFIRQTNGGDSAYHTSANTVPLNTWTHVAVAYNGSGALQFYINGQAVTTTAADPSTFDPLTGGPQDSSDFSLFIGETNDFTRAFEGRINEVRVWNTFRSVSQVASNYDQSIEGFPAGLVGYWPMIRGQGGIVEDFSGNGNAGIIDGARWDAGNIPGLASYSLWSVTLELGSGWRYSPWFGLFNDSFEPWIYHADLGWLYQSAESEESIYFYDPVIEEWLWTGRSVFPYFYRPQSQDWVFYDIGSSNPRYFYNFTDSIWEAQ